MKSKILFIEDDPDQILIYQSKFKLEGLSMISASDGEEAIKLTIEEKPDLILIDLLLKNENGLDILAQLKKEEQTKNIPVIVFTNFEKREYRDKALELGAVDFIIKAQVTPSRIVERIQKILKN